MPISSPSYWRYWGKTQPEGDYHLLPLHALDVAAVLAALLPGQPFLIGWTKHELFPFEGVALNAASDF